MNEDDITIRDHLTVRDRGDERRIPDSGISLYVDEGQLKAAVADGSRQIPIERISLGSTVVTVDEASDLPDPSSGVRTLDSTKLYLFTDIVADTYTLNPNGAPLVGFHGSKAGFLKVDGGVAVQSSGSDFFADRMYFHCPGGQIFDLQGSVDERFLFQDSSNSDAAGMGDAADLGTIYGFKVVSIKGVNWANFGGGLTLTGTSDKVFIEGSPFREVDADDVYVIEFDANFETEIVDIVNNYAKKLVSEGNSTDTEVVHVDSGATINDVFQYRGTTHETATVSKDKIFGGVADPQKEPYWVQSSYPLRDSSVVGELSLDSSKTVTISSADTWYTVGGTTTQGNESERTRQQSNGVLEYIGRTDINVHVSATTSFSGANGDTYRLAIAKNGTVEPASTMEIEAGGQNAPQSLVTSAVEDLQNGDTVSMQIKNVNSASDATFASYTINFLG